LLIGNIDEMIVGASLSNQQVGRKVLNQMLLIQPV